jgi:hypothetical protein
MTVVLLDFVAMQMRTVSIAPDFSPGISGKFLPPPGLSLKETFQEKHGIRFWLKPILQSVASVQGCNISHSLTAKSREVAQSEKCIVNI